MTVGFEEDSPFYRGPLIDTREDIKAEEKEQDKVIQTSTVKTPKDDETTFSYERDDE